MDESIIIDKLVSFGLTKQEAVIYICLYVNGEMSGYEVAKQTGISRSNVYSALSGLADKGAVYLSEGVVSKYDAVQIQEFCTNKIRNITNEMNFLIKHIPNKKEQEIGYITIEGYINIWNKIIQMIMDASQRIYISAAGKNIRLLIKELELVLDKDIKLVILTDAPIDSQKINDKGIVYKCEERGDNIRLIIDSEYALTGELTDSKEDTCLYTGQKNFISVFKETLRNEIKLIDLQGGKI